MFRKSLIIARLKREIQSNAERQLRNLNYGDYAQLLHKIVSDTRLQSVSPRKFGIMTAYTPRQLSEMLKLVLQLPTELAAVLSFETLPMCAPTFGLPPTIGGDFSMTLERTFLVAPDLGEKGAEVLARTVILGSHFGLTWFVRGTVERIGKFGMPSGEAELMVPEPRMAGEVVKELERLSPELTGFFR